MTEIVGKKGVHTSEFWLSLASLVSALLIGVFGEDFGISAQAQNLAVVAPPFVAGIYTLSRSITKAKTHEAIAKQNSAVAEAAAVTPAVTESSGPPPGYQRLA